MVPGRRLYPLSAILDSYSFNNDRSDKESTPSDCALFHSLSHTRHSSPLLPPGVTPSTGLVLHAAKESILRVKKQDQRTRSDDRCVSLFRKSWLQSDLLAADNPHRLYVLRPSWSGASQSRYIFQSRIYTTTERNIPSSWCVIRKPAT